MPSVGPAEILVILVVALLVFGPNRLPEIGRQVGKAMRELRRMQASLRDEVRDVLEPMSTEPAHTPQLPPKPDAQVPADAGAQAREVEADDDAGTPADDAGTPADDAGTPADPNAEVPRAEGGDAEGETASRDAG